MSKKVTNNTQKRNIKNEQDKIEAEVKRSMSVIKMKKAHKEIEDIEKIRKQKAVASIIKRIEHVLRISQTLIGAITKKQKEFSGTGISFDIKPDVSTEKYADILKANAKAIYFDRQKTIKINQNDFDILFPKTSIDTSTYDTIQETFNILNLQLVDVIAYCTRLI